jgi:hypothetical protein
MHYFNVDELENNKKYTFQVFYLNKGLAYKNYYYLLKRNPDNQEILFLVLQDSKTQEINLIIEISDMISVNYLHRYTGANTLNDVELVNILNAIMKLFKINYSVIHPRFMKYKNNVANISDILDSKDEYQEKDILLNFSADLTMYNLDVLNYINNKNNNHRFITMKNVINKMDIYFLDRLKRLSPDLMLKIEDTDELYRLYKKNKFMNISNMLLYLHEHYFYLIPLFIKKMTVLQSQPLVH